MGQQMPCRFVAIAFIVTVLALFFAAVPIGAWQGFDRPSEAAAAGQGDGGNRGQQPNLAETPVAEPAGDVQTASFQGIVPGETPLEEVTQALGDPLGVKNEDGAMQLTYKVGPFPRVEIALLNRVVTSIVIHLSKPAAPAKIAGELGLSALHPAPVPEPNGQLLGQAYPERGVLFVFTDNDELLEVSHIVLEPISAEPFLLRARHDREHRYTRSLTDLKYAQQLAPNDARGYALEAEILIALGRAAEADRSARKAALIAPDNMQYKLLEARLLAAAGKHDLAVAVSQRVAAVDNTAPEVRSQAELQWGDALAAGSGGDFQAAIEHHLQAIRLVKPLIDDARFDVRRTAKRILVEAHLAVARDIAWGNWNRKDETSAKWINNAAAISEDFIRRDNGDPVLRFTVNRQKLAVLAGLNSQADPADAVQAAVRAVADVLGDQVDPQYRSQLEWELGAALFDAAIAEQARARSDAALKYAKQSLALVERAAPARDATPAREYLMGKLYFRIGSIYAAAQGNHQQAITWYDKAAVKFSQPPPAEVAGEAVLHGERLVSMGASYWQTGHHDLGLQNTQRGVQLIEAAVGQGQADRSALAVPYGNLAAMHRHLGNDTEAKEFAETAARLETGQGGRKLR